MWCLRDTKRIVQDTGAQEYKDKRFVKLIECIAR